MASASGGKAVNGHKLAPSRIRGDHSLPEEISVVYEDLFNDEAGERPCYLPDSGQDEANPPALEGYHDDEEDDSKLWDISRKGSRGSLTGKGKLKGLEEDSPPAAMDGERSGLDTWRGGSKSSSGEDESLEKDEDGEKVGTDSSSVDRSVVLDQELSSERGVDVPTSPSSSQGGTSGYMAGSGSSSRSSASGVEVTAEIAPHQETEEAGRRETPGTWEPGKRHPDEDDSHVSWRQHKKHFFILSNAGKPIYSRYGDEHKLAGFSATLQAIMSFVQNSGDTIHLVRAGDHQILFLVRGPLYLVCISSTDEPYLVLKEQVELLHGQLLMILTKAVEKCFVKNSKFDMRPLLGGTEVVFSSLIHAFSWDPASFIHAYTCLPLPYAARQAAVVALQDLTDTGALFALLMCGAKVIGLVGPRKASLHPDDILLLSNFISSSESFRTSESFSPICLPRYNPSAFMYAYVQYLDKDTYLTLLTGDSGNFFHLKECRAQIELVLKDSDVLGEVNNSLQRGGLRVEDLPEEMALMSAERGQTSARTFSTSSESVLGVGGPSGLWHFIYRSTYLDQYVASEFSPPLHTRSAQKRLFRAYQKLHTSMNENGAAGPHKMQYRRDNKHVLLSWRTSDFELYAAFDPLAQKVGYLTWSPCKSIQPHFI